jgi:ERF superfamily
MPVRGAATKTSAARTSAPAEEVLTEDVVAVFRSEAFRKQHLVSKLAAVMGVVSHVPKRGYNDFHKYRYVMEADLVGTIRPLLAASGIMIVPSVIREEFEPNITTTRSGSMSMTRILVQYTITDGTDEIVMSIPGHGMDSGDKGIYKAMTGSMKYALMKLFEVDTGDDPENDTRVDRVNVSITPSSQDVEKGGHSKTATRYQLQRISATMREKGMDRQNLLNVIAELFGTELLMPEDQGEAQGVIITYLQELSEEDAGALLGRLDEWSENEDA